MAMTNINIRIDADKKLKAQELFSSLGLDMTTAINLFIQQSLASVHDGKELQRQVFVAEPKQ